MRHAYFSFALLSTLAAAMLTSCVSGVPLEGRSCPCATGWVCCPDENICVQDQSTCKAPEPPAPPAPAPDPFAGTWTGHQERFGDTMMSDALKLVISGGPEATRTITIVFGTMSPPPPPTDGTVYWPSWRVPDEKNPLARENDTPLIEGFVYTGIKVRVDGQRLRFAFRGEEPWQPWCAMQTSYLNDASVGRYSPIPGSGSYNYTDGQCVANDGHGTIVSCVVAADSGKCSCDANGCFAGDEGYGGTFDLTLQGDKMEGTPGVDIGPNYIRLTRTAP